MESKSIIEQSKTSTNDEEEKTAFDLLQLPTISEAIFKYLSARDLSSCAKLCRSWNATATLIKQKREHIYVISRVEVGINDLKSVLTNLSYDLWSDPTMAISFFVTEVYQSAKQSFNDEILFDRHYSAEDEGHFFVLREQYMISIQKARRQKRLRNYLPEKCTLVNLMTPRWCHDTPLVFPSSALILFPSNPRVQVQPFLIPRRHRSDVCTSKEVESLFLSGGTTCLQDTIKCLITFVHPQDINSVLDTETYVNSSVEKYVSEETIVVNCYDSLFPTNLGIAFAGENVRSECVVIDDRECCLLSSLSFLEESGFNEEVGIAFVLRRPYVFVSEIMNFWYKAFPYITPLFIVIPDIRTCIPKPSITLPRCDFCGAQLSLESKQRKPFVILFVLFEDTIIKISPA